MVEQKACACTPNLMPNLLAAAFKHTSYRTRSTAEVFVCLIYYLLQKNTFYIGIWLLDSEWSSPVFAVDVCMYLFTLPHYWRSSCAETTHLTFPFVCTPTSVSFSFVMPCKRIDWHAKAVLKFRDTIFIADFLNLDY